MILERQLVTYIRIFFGHCRVTFPYMEPLLFLVGFVQKVIVFYFSDSFDQEATQQSDGICNVTNDTHLHYKFFK